MTVQSGCPMSRRTPARRRRCHRRGCVAVVPRERSRAGYDFPEINTAVRPDRFGRLFDLEPFAEPKPKIVAALKALGAPGGIMDVGDDLAAGPLGLILNPGANRDNAAHTAGHDVRRPVHRP